MNGHKNIIAVMSGMLICLLLVGTAAAAPVINSATTNDTDEDGYIDAYEINFSESVNASTFNYSNWTIENYEINESVSTNADGLYGNGSTNITIALNESDDYDTGVIPDISTDGAGILNTTASPNTSLENVSSEDVTEKDGAAPFLISATTIDDDGDAKIDGYEMKFSEPLDHTSVDESNWNFEYDGRTSFDLDYTTGDTIVTMIFTENPAGPDTSTTPYLEVIGEVDDLYGNDLANEVVDGIDGVAPVITDVYSDATEAGVLGISDEITFTIELEDSDDYDYANSSTYNGKELSWTQDASGLITATYQVDNGEDDQSTPLDLNDVNVTDAAENTANNEDITDVEKTIDANYPGILNATTLDMDDDGQIDAYEIIFNESVNDSSFNYGNWTVSGYTLAEPYLIEMESDEANDSIIYINITESGSNDTASLPNVTTDADAITDLAGNELATVGDVDVTEEDGAAPIIETVVSEAYNEDGDSLADDEILGLNDWVNFTVVPALNKEDVEYINTSTFNGEQLSWTEEDDGNWTATYIVSEDDSSSMDAKLTDVNATDAAGNTGPSEDDASDYIINAGGPVIVDAYTMDENSNGLIDGYNVSFIEPINDSTVNISNWNVEGHDITGWDTGVENDTNVYIYFDEIDVNGTAATPNVTIIGPEVADLDGDELKQEFCDGNDDITEYDGAAPVLMHAEIDSSDDPYSVDVTFSETVYGNEGNVTFKDGNPGLSESAESWYFEYDGQLQTGDSPEITAVNNMMDGPGNAAVLYGDTGVVVNTFRKELKAGYNYVSFPIADEGDVTLADVGLDGNEVDSVWTYNPQDGWIVNSDDAFEIAGGVGYIVCANEDFFLAPNVNNYPDNFETPASTNVYEGWNLVGHYKAYEQSISGAFATLVDNRHSVIYEQRTAGELGLRQLNDIVGLSVKDESKDISTGSAYWINLNEDDQYSTGLNEQA